MHEYGDLAVGLRHLIPREGTWPSPPASSVGTHCTCCPSNGGHSSEAPTAKDCSLVMSRGGAGGRTVGDGLVIPLQCADFRGARAHGGGWWGLDPSPALAPIHDAPSVGTHRPRRKHTVLARKSPDVGRQEILVIKSSVIQRGLTWEMTSSRTP